MSLSIIVSEIEGGALDIPHFSGILLSQVSTVGNTKGGLHAKFEPDPAQTGREFYEKPFFSGF